MKKSYKSIIKFSTIIYASIILCGCASKSEIITKNLDKNLPYFNSLACQNSVRDATFHSDVKILKTIALPTSIIITSGLFVIPAIAASVSLNVLDRIDASNMSVRCGGSPTKEKIIQKEIVKDVLIDSVTVFPLF